MWPTPADDIADALCRLYADTDKSRVIAVIGARGGIGASTIAHNLAWCIAERQHAAAALLDLDLAFGAASYAPKEGAEFSIADAFARLDAIDETLDRTAIERTPRLRIFNAPAAVERALEPEPEALQAVIAHARRMSAFVVLDLPHAWNAWIKHALLGADDIVIVSGPDLASLRNTDNMLKLLRSEPGRVASPIVALSMVGVPKRPEIPFKDFSEALVLAPSATFAFDPALYSSATMAGQSIYEAAPNSKAARALDALATQLTGCEPVESKNAPPTTLPTLAELGIEPSKDVAEGSKPQTAPSESIADAPLAEAKPVEPEAVAAPEKPREDVRVDELPPLELVVEAPPLVETAPPAPDRFAEARKVAQVELAALQREHAPPRPRRRSSGLLRAAAALAVMAFLGSWYLQNQHSPAIATVEPARAEAAIAPAPQPATPGPNDALSAYLQALGLIEAGDAQAGMANLVHLAEEGSALAQYRLAKFYERGEHVEANAEAARAWTERAAQGGNVAAMHDLGVYLAREGAERDDAGAFRWFRQAAEFGFADSQFNLGVLYQDGRGVTANPAEALFWFLLAARNGDGEATMRATALEAALPATDIEQAHARARFFNQRAPNPAANITQSSERAREAARQETPEQPADSAT
jgi:MinD-like ATPase involved in chromosome partitioning or flagellar assembly/TPR repeat protein